MPINQKLLTLWVLCLTLIALALAYKLYTIAGKPTNSNLSQSPTKNEVIETSKTFYEKEESDKTPQTPAKKESPITAKAYLVGNVQTGQIYLSKNPNAILPVASMSKLITAIESIDRYSTAGKVLITKDESSSTDPFIPKIGEVFTVNELLYPLLLNSSNIAAEILASSSSRSQFMSIMSSYAWEIGMPATYFFDPSGISPQNISSANDFFALARYLYKLRPDILSITKIADTSISTTTEHGSYYFKSTHPFVTDPSFLGGKTGRTIEARETMLSLFSINGQPIAIIVLASENRQKDTLYLKNQIEH